ncbi:mating type pheromone receptor 4 [Rhizopogon vesiculosus]|uniref:Mating type pheromone receptor 4 n=1 Tax=Rhizopogon vesiculosus TaxID=180088 RepID=A0A1J8QH83_9AGAM|nr:mating type pheromone receptor 4 [Rhizopogon vesiculosus]
MQTVIPVLSFISAVLVLFPLPWHFRARNIAAMSIGVWLFVVNIIYAIDAFQWPGAYRVASLLWCDITSALITAVNVSIPAACLCICIHLERMASFCASSTSIAKRRRILFECLMCFGLPMAYAALRRCLPRTPPAIFIDVSLIDLIVQPRRFDVYANFGCRPATYPSILALLLVWTPPLALSFVTLLFCGITWRHFLLHGVQFSRTRASSSLTSGAYIRLISMAVSEVICTIAATVVAMVFNLNSGLAPWADFTRDWTEILSFSSAATPRSTTAMLITEWVFAVAQCFFFIGLFLLGGEGRSRLHEALQVVRSTFTFPEKLSTCLADHKGTSITECDLTPTPSLTILEFKSVTSVSSTACTYHGYSSEKPLPPSPAPSRPRSLDLAHAKQLEESPDFLDPALLPLESPSVYSTIASSHNSLESNFDPQQLVLYSTQWPKPPSAAFVKPRPRSSSMNVLRPAREGSPFEGFTVPRHKHLRNSQSRNAVYMTVVREIHEAF